MNYHEALEYSIPRLKSRQYDVYVHSTTKMRRTHLILHMPKYFFSKKDVNNCCKYDTGLPRRADIQLRNNFDLNNQKFRRILNWCIASYFCSKFSAKPIHST